jgi:glycosyltransferase involved in cell wall biosynthesis
MQKTEHVAKADTSADRGQASHRAVPHRRCLVLTPATRFGSWERLERLMSAAPDVEWIVVSYGRPKTAAPHIRFISIPGPSYIRIARVMARRRYHALNVFYSLPLVPIAWVVGALTRPTVLLGNGLVASAALLPLKLLGARVVVGFHGYIGNAGYRSKQVMRWVLAASDAAFVNSATSLEDLQTVIDFDKIVVVPNWADDVFFNVPLERPRRDTLVVLYVGRLDTEKFSQCLRVTRRLVGEGSVELWAVGAGPLEGEVKSIDGVRLFGYVECREDLASIYAQADVVWAPADSTYVSAPGIEGLASGCPLIVSDIPAVDARADAGVRIPRDLVPPEIGFVVDGLNDIEAVAILRELVRAGIPNDMRAACRRFAAREHSVAVTERALELIRV